MQEATAKLKDIEQQLEPLQNNVIQFPFNQIHLARQFPWILKLTITFEWRVTIGRWSVVVDG